MITWQSRAVGGGGVLPYFRVMMFKVSICLRFRHVFIGPRGCRQGKNENHGNSREYMHNSTQEHTKVKQKEEKGIRGGKHGTSKREKHTKKNWLEEEAPLNLACRRAKCSINTVVLSDLAGLFAERRGT